MTTRNVLGASLLGAVTLLGVGTFRGPVGPVVNVAAQQAAAPADAVLTGTVGSTTEPRMEGVLVSAKRDGTTKITTVVSNAEGVYSFPRGRLEPGRYNVSIRAAGYVLPGASAARAVDVTAGAAAHLNLDLRAANVLERALQMTDPEWLASYPLDEETKWTAFRDCSRCHTHAARVDVHLQQRAAGVGDEADGLFRRQFADDVPAAERAADAQLGPRGMGRALAGHAREPGEGGGRHQSEPRDVELRAEDACRGPKGRTRRSSTRRGTCR